MIKKCEYCGTAFKINEKVKREREKKTCSRSCAGKLGRRNAPYVKTSCKFCRKDFKIKKPQLDKEGNFCSNDCRKNRHTLQCLNCDSKFTSSKPRTKFCSRGCFDEYQKSQTVILQCTECKTDFERASAYIGSTDRVFCSVRCSNRFHGRNRENHYGTRWSRIRRKIIERDMGVCQNCGIQPNEKYQTHVHHIVDANKFESPEEANKHENLVTLCRECHIDIHKHTQ